MSSYMPLVINHGSKNKCYLEPHVGAKHDPDAKERADCTPSDTDTNGRSCQIIININYKRISITDGFLCPNTPTMDGVTTMRSSLPAPRYKYIY